VLLHVVGLRTRRFTRVREPRTARRRPGGDREPQPGQTNPGYVTGEGSARGREGPGRRSAKTRDRLSGAAGEDNARRGRWWRAKNSAWRTRSLVTKKVADVPVLAVDPTGLRATTRAASRNLPSSSTSLQRFERVAAAPDPIPRETTGIRHSFSAPTVLWTRHRSSRNDVGTRPRLQRAPLASASGAAGVHRAEKNRMASAPSQCIPDRRAR